VAVAGSVGVGELLDGNSMVGTAVFSAAVSKVGVEIGLVVEGTAVIVICVTSGTASSQAAKISKAIITKVSRRIRKISNLKSLVSSL
jgi:hypothetical protein